MPAIPAIIGTVVSGLSSAGAAIAGGASSVAGALGASPAVAAGIGSAAEGAAGGSLLGAGEAAITGKPIGQGAEFGAITGGALGGLGPVVQGATGLSAPVADALVGAGAGALGGEVTGIGPLSGALSGGISGGITGALGGGGVKAGGAAPAASSLATSSSFDLGPDPLSTPPIGSSVNIEGIPASGTLTAPVQSTLPGSVGAGASAGGTPSLTSIEGIPVNQPLSSSITPSTTLATAAPSAATAPAAASAGGGSSFSKFFSNPMNDLIVGSLGIDLLKGNQQSPYEKTLSGIAGQDAQQGAMLENYALSGTLPPGLQAGLTGATDAAKAATENFYATRGMSGSSAAAEDLGALQMREQAQAGQIAQQLFQSGLSESQLATGIYENLVNTQIQQDNEFSQAVGNLAAAFARSAAPIAAAA